MDCSYRVNGSAGGVIVPPAVPASNTTSSTMLAQDTFVAIAASNSGGRAPSTVMPLSSSCAPAIRKASPVDPNGPPLTWQGDWRNGRPWNGTGIVTNALGVVEDANWINGLQEGKYFATNPDGTTWTGIAKGGTYWEGSGTGVDINSGARVRGAWTGGNLQGAVHFDNPDRTTFDAIYADGQIISGHGTLLLPDGSRLEGTFNSGTLNGTFTDRYGHIYSGLAQVEAGWVNGHYVTTVTPTMTVTLSPNSDCNLL